jgi:FAD/FMN-containing dehydrogenase
VFVDISIFYRIIGLMNDGTAPPKSIQTLKQAFSGEIILPGDDAYETVRSSFMEEGHPALVAMAETQDDVALAIQYACEHSLILSIRSGGHSNAGLSTNEGGMVIDLSKMNSVEVLDREKQTVRLGAGAKWGIVAKTLKDFGLALTSGDTVSVGIGGLTLGAGIGWMVRKYGLAIDNLLAVELVTADGEKLRADKNRNSDLFWAVRGGGGNFGVVTSFEFQAHQVGKVYAGVITYKPDNLDKLLRGWRDYMREAPDELTTMLALMPSFGPEMPSSFMVMCCWDTDDKEAAEAALKPLRNLDGEVISDDIKEKDYCDVLEEAHKPEGMKIIVNNTFVPELSDALIDTIAECFKRTPFVMQIRSLGGAMARVPADATAFAHRDSEAFIVLPTFLPPTATDGETDAALETWRKVAAYGKGAYINFFTHNTDEDVAAAYPEATLKRLALIKKQYDPQNVFNQNYNIKPAG